MVNATGADYYAYGQPHPDCVAPELSVRKYSAKELLTSFGLDEYDFAARRLTLTGRFTQPDPLAGAMTDPESGDALSVPYLSHVSPYAYCAADPINLIDPTGLSTNVVSAGQNKFKVVGGDINDGDLNIYEVAISDDGSQKRLRGIGLTPCITTFYDSDRNAWSRAIIDLNDMSGINFLNEIYRSPPPLEYYVFNARNNHRYDFKVTNGTNHVITGLDKYRGMIIDTNPSGMPIIASARDIGNLTAGYIAGLSNIPWSWARYAFDAYQSRSLFPETKEGISTVNAERYGWELGMNKPSAIKNRYLLINIKFISTIIPWINF